MATSNTVVTTLGGFTFTHVMKVTGDDIETTVTVTDGDDEQVLEHVGSRPKGR